MPQHQQLSILRHLTAEQDRHGTQDTARYTVRDRQEHRARISARPSKAACTQVTGAIAFPSPTGNQVQGCRAGRAGRAGWPGSSAIFSSVVWGTYASCFDGRQVGVVVPVRQRAVTAVIAHRTRASAEPGRLRSRAPGADPASRSRPYARPVPRSGPGHRAELHRRHARQVKRLVSTGLVVEHTLGLFAVPRP